MRIQCDLCDRWFTQQVGPVGGRPRKRCYDCAPYKDTTAKVRAHRDAAAYRTRYGVRCLLCPELGAFVVPQHAVAHLRSHERPAA